MTQPKARKPTTPDPDPPADPLAAYREPDPTIGDLEYTPDPPAAEPASVGLVTQADQDRARAVVVATWHADTVALGFLHKGGVCGCQYLAVLTVQAVVPVTPEPVEV